MNYDYNRTQNVDPKTTRNATLLISVHYADGTHKTVKRPDTEETRANVRTDRASGAVVYVTRYETTITSNEL